MATYITITIDCDALTSSCVNKHCAHDDGTITWRIDGKHDPLYLQGTVEALKRFADSVKSAVADAEGSAS